MSQFIQHPASSIKLSFAARKAAWLVSLVVLVVVAATAVILLVSDNNDSSSAATPQSSSAPLTRYDGGPDEGTAGIAGQSTVAPSIQRPFHGGGFTERYNGGPEEGTAGR